jgi:antagonist of KipI
VSGRALLDVLSAGLLSTVQDAGRPDAAHLGVPRSGACDPLALAVANLLIGNEPGAAAIEISLLGPELAVLEPCVVGIAGADFEARLGADAGRRIAPATCVTLEAGDTLRFGAALDGARGYLALPGGIDVPEILGSASTAPVGGFGGLGGRPLAAGDRLAARSSAATESEGRHWPGPGPSSGIRPGDRPRTVRVLAGPHADAAGPDTFEHLVSATWDVGSQSDRMGIRLEGPPLQSEGRPELVSSGVAWGAVQLPPGGRPIVLLADAPTVGGYPVVAVVASVDRPVIGQLRAGDRLRLVPVTLDEAREALRAAAQDLAEATRRLAFGTAEAG